MGALEACVTKDSPGICCFIASYPSPFPPLPRQDEKMTCLDLPPFCSSSSSFLLHLRQSPDVAQVGLDLTIPLSTLLEC